MKHAPGCTGNVHLQLLVDRPTPPPPASPWSEHGGIYGGGDTSESVPKYVLVTPSWAKRRVDGRVLPGGELHLNPTHRVRRKHLPPDPQRLQELSAAGVWEVAASCRQRQVLRSKISRRPSSPSSSQKRPFFCCVFFPLPSVPPGWGPRATGADLVTGTKRIHGHGRHLRTPRPTQQTSCGGPFFQRWPGPSG